MKNICNISKILPKILVMLLLVVFLAACGEDNELADADNACEVQVEGAERSKCMDTDDVGCLGCQIFTLMFNAVSSNVMHMHGQLTQGAMALMMVCFSVWLAIRLLKFVSSVSESSISQVWNEILKQGFLCLFCGILASSPSMLIYAVNTFVYPIYAAMLKLGIAIMETTVKEGDTGQTTTFTVFGQVTAIQGVNLGCTFDKVGLVTEKGFPKEFLDTIVCMIKTLKTYLAIGGKISLSLVSQSASFMGIVTGFVLLAFFWVVRIGFVFYLVDTIFQMGIIILVLPIFIMSYAFNTTRKWTTIAIQNTLASAGFLMCFSVVVTLVLRGMIELIKNNPSIFNPTDAEHTVANLGLGFLCLLLIGFLIYGSMGITQQIAGALIGAEVDAKFQEKLRKALDMVKGWAIAAGGAALSLSSSLLPQGLHDSIEKIKKLRKRANKLRGKKD